MGGHLKQLLVQEGLVVPSPPEPGVLTAPVWIPNPSDDTPLDEAQQGVAAITGTGILCPFEDETLLYLECADGTGDCLVMVNRTAFDSAPANAPGTAFQVMDDGTFNIQNFNVLIGTLGSELLMGPAGGTDPGLFWFYSRNGSATVMGAPGSLLGFYGNGGAFEPNPAVAKQTITGAKLPSDVVLANLLTALHALGLITDATT